MSNAPPPHPSPRPPFASAALRRCRTTPQLKQAHAAILVRGLPLPPSSPPLLRPSFSFSALHPSGDVRYALLLLLFSLPLPSPRAASVRFLYNTVIRGLARRPRLPGALPDSALLFRRMTRGGLAPSGFTFTFLLQACAGGSPVPGASLGRLLHAAVVKNAVLGHDTCVLNSLIRFYSACGQLDEARRVFAEAGDDGRRDVVSWNSIIDGCLRNGDVPGALVLFDRMPERNTVSWNALITGLVRNDRLDAARCLFDGMPDKNLVSWAVMISGYAQNRQPREALRLFREMQLVQRELNTSVLVSALSAASQMGALNHGKWIESYVRRYQVRMEPSLSTALVNTYANCGSIQLAMQLFYSLKPSQKDLSTYTAAVFGLAMNGQGGEALQLFEHMRSVGFMPDNVSYLAVLCACSHMGWVEQGFDYFEYMVGVDCIEADLDHYACMVDLLGRAGFLKQAENFIASMPMEPDNVIWGALLNACKIHGNAEMGKRVGEFLMKTDQLHDGRYVVLSNILVESSNMDGAEQVRQTMRRRNIGRVPGFSSIELNGVIHEFVAGDKSHEKTSEIYRKWEEMTGELRKVGYAAETRGIGFEVEEEEKEVVVGYHSEKLAIAFGFISTQDKSPLRIVKNIRICRDCHSAIKLISMVFERKIVVRDRKRFHHFEGGICSCMDFW
uniref:Pentatricopeptide repeat-containing protein At5g48910 n=1 Tax=Anthurium amnicola TaxID=1678845 RepID=A0A1D1XQV2_9ARAE